MFAKVPVLDAIAMIIGEGYMEGRLSEPEEEKTSSNGRQRFCSIECGLEYAMRQLCRMSWVPDEMHDLIIKKFYKIGRDFNRFLDFLDVFQGECVQTYTVTNASPFKIEQEASANKKDVNANSSAAVDEAVLYFNGITWSSRKDPHTRGIN